MNSIESHVTNKEHEQQRKTTIFRNPGMAADPGVLLEHCRNQLLAIRIRAIENACGLKRPVERSHQPKMDFVFLNHEKSLCSPELFWLEL